MLFSIRCWMHKLWKKARRQQKLLCAQWRSRCCIVNRKFLLQEWGGNWRKANCRLAWTGPLRHVNHLTRARAVTSESTFMQWESATSTHIYGACTVNFSREISNQMVWYGVYMYHRAVQWHRQPFCTVITVQLTVRTKTVRSLKWRWFRNECSASRWSRDRPPEFPV
jgi:hypothetical protein